MALIELTPDDDIYKADPASQSVSGLAGNDRIEGGAGADFLHGGATEWKVIDSTHVTKVGDNDTLNGGEHDDFFLIGTGSDQIDGGSGFNTCDFSNIVGQFFEQNANGFVLHRGDLDQVNVNLRLGTYRGNYRDVFDQTVYGTAQGGLANIQLVIGSHGNDTLIGGDLVNDKLERLQGNAGDDFIDGGTGYDELIYYISPGSLGPAPAIGANVTFTSANAGTAIDPFGDTDTFKNIEAAVGSLLDDTLTGFEGTQIFAGSKGADVIDGGLGVDHIDYRLEFGGHGVEVRLADNFARDTFGTFDTLRNIENIDGAGAHDTLFGDAADNVITGGAGNDAIGGLGGADTLIAGSFDDTVDGGTGEDKINGDEGNDSITAGDGNDTASGDAGNDTIAGGDSNDSLSGGDNLDRLLGQAGADTLAGEAGNDDLAGGDAADDLEGGDDNDALKGDRGNDTLNGGDGDDTLDGGAGVLDVADYGDATAGVTANLLTGVATGQGRDRLAAVENLLGSSHNDRLTGDDQNNALFGADGADALDGGAGNDALSGGRGNDLIEGGDGHDTVIYSASTSAVEVSLKTGRASGGLGSDRLSGLEGIIGSNHADELTGFTALDTITGGKGDDTIDGGAGDNALDGGAGRDTLRFDSRTLSAGVVVNFLEGTTSSGPDRDKIENFEDAIGTSKADTLIGDDKDNHFFGNAGDDVLRGGDGDDVLNGGAGRADQASFSDAASAIRASLATGRVTGEGADTLTGIENLSGSAHDDRLTGDRQVNQIFGQGGADSIDGGAESDDLRGGAGNDTVKGGAGNDDIQGGNDQDQLSGEAGNDFIKGGRHDDTIAGGNQNDELYGDDNDDSLSGEIGADILTGGSGNDELVGGAGDDALFGDSVVTLKGEIIRATAGDDRLDGSAGLDSVSYAASARAITASLLDGTASGEGADTLVNIEKLFGSRHNDTLEGSNGDDALGGLAGNDVLAGLAGNDTIVGSAGRDTIDGGAGQDTVIFDAALRLTIRGIPGNLVQIIFGDGEAQGDVLTSIERLEGSPDQDRIDVSGDVGVGVGGGSGNDSIRGGGGGDTIDGGLGRDRLTGGEGRDVFVFSTPPKSTTNVDTIADFNPAEDIIQLARAVFDAAGRKGALDPAAFVIGPAATNEAQHVIYDPETGSLLYDADGKGGDAATPIANLGRDLTMTAADIFIV
ncbi:calcium-binding protein [soil metagenome]